jgi:hypothetical protein
MRTVSYCRADTTRNTARQVVGEPLFYACHVSGFNIDNKIDSKIIPTPWCTQQAAQASIRDHRGSTARNRL